MNKITNLIITFLISFQSIICAETPETSASFANGADVGWLTQMEAAGKKFYNAEGVQTECMSLLKGLGINSIRLRVWVNPTGGWNNAADVLVKAKRANDLGLRLMIDFHYSDTWADPVHQTKPAAWTNLNFTDLKTAVATHTTEVLTLLKDNGITPEWVQVGNETGDGMLWDTGKANVSMANYADLTTAGYNAVKAVFSDCKVIVHIHNGFDNGLFRWIFDGLKNNGGKWDVIGMSLYPNWYKTPFDWVNCNKDCQANMNDMVSRYGKEVMIVECGMSWDSAAICYNFLTDLIQKTKSVPNGKGIGVFYWEPQSYGQWEGYTLGAFDNSGLPTIAMNAFKSTTQNSEISLANVSYRWYNSQRQLKFNKIIANLSVYSTDGKLLYSGENSEIFIMDKIANGNHIIKYTDAESNLTQSILLYFN